MAKYGKVASDRGEARSQSSLEHPRPWSPVPVELQKIEVGCVCGGWGGFYLGLEQVDFDTINVY